MYEWIGEVKKLFNDLDGERNDVETRKNVTADTIEILNKSNVIARVDCSSRVNTTEVINNAGFVMVVDTKDVMYTFNHIRKESE